MALATSVRWSRKAWAAELDGEPIAIWGVAPFGSWLGDKGSPWLLGSDRMKEVSIIGARVSQPFVLEMLSMFTMLENYVSNDNKLSIRWLRWCGFKMDHPEPFGLERKLFRRFWMKKGG
jgi:hypothetical protein